MPHVAGQIRIGFEAPVGHPYHLLPDAHMKNLKNKVTAEVHAAIDVALRNGWDGVDIEVDAEGHRPESELRDWLIANLPALTGNADLALLGPASFASVRYQLWDTSRHCEHSHALTRLGVPWTATSDDVPAVAVQLVIQIRWGIPVA